MSDEVEQNVEADPTAQSGGTTEPAEGAGLDALMQPAAEPGAVPKSGQERLETSALAAAQAAVAAAEGALDELETEVDTSAADNARTLQQARAKKRLWMLRGALILNFSLMGLLFALPAEQSTKGSSTDTGASEDLPPSPFVEPLRDPRYVIPRDKLYERALKVAFDGNYEEAAELLQRYIETNPGLHPSLMHGTYVLMERYLRLSGRIQESIQYGNLARRLVGQTQLPEDLWHAARAAEEAGDARAMRQAYARLLLQRGMLTSSQLAIVTEAYLKLGDSYRMEADQGEDHGVPPLRDPGGSTDSGHGGHR